MKSPIYQVDAFTAQKFSGRPLSVCPLEAWLSEDTLQSIAKESPIAETAFLVPREADSDHEAAYDLRTFTSQGEIERTDDATLASACVVLSRLDLWAEYVRFHTKGGSVEVARDHQEYSMLLPATTLEPIEPPTDLVNALGMPPAAVLRDHDYVAVFDSAEDVRELTPDLNEVDPADRRVVAVTAPGDGEADYVARSFALQFGTASEGAVGIPHSLLAALWAGRLGKAELSAKLLSPRNGEAQYVVEDTRIRLTAPAVISLEGELLL